MNIIWIHYARPRTAWYELDAAARTELEASWQTVSTSAVEGGAEFLGAFSVRGQGDYSTLEVWGFASADEAFDHWAARVALGYTQWFAHSNQVGAALST